ncbi:MAG: endonuclease domain-containing protein [Mycobacteriales bacterium]
MGVPSAAEVLVACPAAVLSHEEAARRLGIELAADAGVRRVTVPRSFSHVRLPGWVVHRRDVPDPRLLADGMRVTSPARTVLDLATALPLPDAVVSGDSALRAGLVTAAELDRQARAAWGRGRREGVRVTGLLDPACGSVLESLLRVLLHEAGLPAPQTQLLVVDGREEVARVDFAWPGQRLVVEADGYAFHSDRAAFRQDRRRMNELERLGWRVLRFSWEDVVGRPAYVVGLVRHCLAAAA